MTWAPTETQKTVYETLQNDAALLTLLGATPLIQKVFDHVPDNSPYPYLKIAIKPMTDRANESWDGVVVQVQVSIWYQADGLGDLKVQQLQKRVDELLHDVSICIDGWNIISNRRTTANILDEPDGRTKQGIQIFNYLLGEI
jgi:hypothetical protein